MRIRGYADGTPCCVDVSSPDPVISRTFYGSLFGWTTAGAGNRADTIFQLGDLPVAGLSRLSPPRPAGWLTYFATDDLVATAMNVIDAGGTVLREPAQVGREGRAALFADPAGAVFAGWQRDAFYGARVHNEPGAVCWHELATPDVAGARAFYGKVFGFQDRPAELSGYEHFEWQLNERTVGGLVPTSDRWPVRARAAWRVCFLVTECAATVATASGLGGHVVLPPTDVATGRFAQLADPHGATFAVTSLHPALFDTLR